ncbi:MAG: hypothetical protein LWX11_06300 [Firmicutes bacterium]|nr:hypothetical protein [Bacillota bacterium]
MSESRRSLFNVWSSLVAVALVGMGFSLVRFQQAPREDLAFRIERYLPAAMELDQLPTLPSSSDEGDVMMVMLGVGAPKPMLGFLHAHGPVGFRREEPQGRFAVLFRETLDAALLQNLKPHPPHGESLVAIQGGETRRAPAVPGQILIWGDHRFKVVARYPDFEVKPGADGQPQPRTRSESPNDPWLEVDFQGRRVLLSAFQPDLTRRLNAPNLPSGLTLDYRREGEERQRRFVVVTRSDRRVALVEDGVVARSEPLLIGHPFVVASGLSVTPVGLFDRFHSAPSGAAAALRLRVEDRLTHRREWVWLRPQGSSDLFDGKLSLRLEGGEKPVLEVQATDARGQAWPVQRLNLSRDGAPSILSLHRKTVLWGFGLFAALFVVGIAGFVHRRVNPRPSTPL